MVVNKRKETHYSCKTHSHHHQCHRHQREDVKIFLTFSLFFLGKNHTNMSRRQQHASASAAAVKKEDQDQEDQADEEENEEEPEKAKTRKRTKIVIRCIRLSITRKSSIGTSPTTTWNSPRSRRNSDTFTETLRITSKVKTRRIEI